MNIKTEMTDWSPQEIQTAIKMRASNYSIQSISKKIHKNPSDIKRFINFYINSKFSGKAKKWMKHEDKQLMLMKKKGITYQVIALRLKRTINACENRCLMMKQIDEDDDIEEKIFKKEPLKLEPYEMVCGVPFFSKDYLKKLKPKYART